MITKYETKKMKREREKEREEIKKIVLFEELGEDEKLGGGKDKENKNMIPILKLFSSFEIFFLLFFLFFYYFKFQMEYYLSIYLTFCFLSFLGMEKISPNILFFWSIHGKFRGYLLPLMLHFIQFLAFIIELM